MSIIPALGRLIEGEHCVLTSLHLHQAIVDSGLPALQRDTWSPHTCTGVYVGRATVGADGECWPCMHLALCFIPPESPEKDVVAHVRNPSILEMEGGGQEAKVILDYISSLRPA